MKTASPPTISVSMMKAIKRSRYNPAPPDDDFPLGGGFELSRVPFGPHAPAKSESQLLRRICSQTGLSEGDVRKRKAYRQQLAKAASVPRVDPRIAYSLKLLRLVQRDCALPDWHPGLKEAFLRAWQDPPRPLMWQKRPEMEVEWAFTQALAAKAERKLQARTR